MGGSARDFMIISTVSACINAVTHGMRRYRRVKRGESDVSLRMRRCGVSGGAALLCLACLLWPGEGRAADPNYPVAAGTLGQVACQQHPDITYEIYLPSAYGQGTQLPIMITQSPSGGGHASAFKDAGESLSCIIVGNLLSRNGLTRAQYDAYSFPMMLDIRERVDFDPTAMYAGGFSGGAWESFELSQERRQYMAGVLSMGGWMGRQYSSHDRYLSGLLVARVTGDNDTGALSQLASDAGYLSTFGVTIRDWSFVGGHSMGPASVRQEALEWLITNRVEAVAGADRAAEAQAAVWRGQSEAGNGGEVVRECVQALLDHPCSHLALAAENVMDSLMSDYETFRLLDLSGMPGGDLVADYFTYKTHWCYADERHRYYSAVRAFRAIPFSSGDRTAHVNALTSSYDSPIAVTTVDQTDGHAPLTVSYTATNSASMGGLTLSYSWDFGDGDVAVGDGGHHTFPEPGRYVLSLTVTDTNGKRDATTTTIEVQNLRPSVTNFWSGQVENGNTIVGGTVTDPGIETPVTYIYWGEEDGATSPLNWQHVENTGHATSNFSAHLTVNANQRYYFRTMASNSGGDCWAPSSQCIGWTEPVPIPFSESFDALTPWMASVTGPVQYQHGWRSATGASTVTAADGSNQICRIEEDVLDIEFQPGGTNVWLQYQVQMVAPPLPPDDIDITNASAVFWLSEEETLCAMDGTNQVVLSSAAVSNGQWCTVLLNLDYLTRKWAIWVDGQPVAQDLDFMSDTYRELHQFSCSSTAGEANCRLDSLTVGRSRPKPDALFDVDADGLPDAWELKYATGLDELRAGKADGDGDGMCDAHERDCGTHPLDGRSYLRVTATEWAAPQAHVFSWQTETGKSYIVEHTEALDQPWTALGSRLAATPPVNHFTNTVHGESCRFYRIRLTD